MATLQQQPQEICFSSVIDDIIFSTVSESGTLVLSLTFGGSQHQIINEVMYPSEDGYIVIGDLSSLLEPYAKQQLEVVMNCSFTDEAGVASITPVTVIYSRADVNQLAATFCSSHFLTVLNGQKLTSIEREERLYAYNATSVTVTAVVETSGVLTTLTASLSAAATTGSISQFNVSPLNIRTLLGITLGTVIEYTVTAGYRSASFRCIPEKKSPAPALVFINSFGCEEFIYCVGTHKKVSKYERLSARFSGLKRNYRITEDRQFTANTGWLNEAMADWADELFRSDEVHLWVDGTKGREVILSDSKSEITNEDDDMPAFEFTYTYAQRIHNIMQPTHAGRVFDNTFDHTFN